MRHAGSVAALAALTSGCAREMPPPGALPDQQPPGIRDIQPAPDTVITGFDGVIRIRFDEPVDIPNDMARRLFASPMERYELETGFSELRLRPRDGWRDSTIYCLRIPDGVSDLLRNRTEQPTSFCFSTGLAIPATRVEGTVRDVITGLPSNEARVVFLAPGDSTPYGALTDGDGRFTARSLPVGEYQAFGFLDQNSNFALDKNSEANDSVTFLLDAETVPELNFVVVPADSTPPLLLRVEATDSITIQLEFDDYLANPPAEPPVIVVRDSATQSELSMLGIRIGQPLEVRFPATDTFPADSLGAPLDSLGAGRDSLGVEADTAAAIAAEIDSLRPPPELLTPLEETEPRPSRFVSVRLESALDSGTYFVETSRIVNLRGLAGGGDTTFVVAMEPPVPDSLLAAPDSLALPPDTLGTRPDTLGTPPDTLGTRRDRLGTRRDALLGRRVDGREGTAGIGGVGWMRGGRP